MATKKKMPATRKTVKKTVVRKPAKKSTTKRMSAQSFNPVPKPSQSKVSKKQAAALQSGQRPGVIGLDHAADSQ